jgi:serine/threonine protein kinase
MGPELAIVVLERLRKGNLLSILNDPKVGSFNSPTRLRIAFEIASALQFCHTNGILHLDVKPQNVLLDFQGNCKLTDFGNSRRMSDLMLSSNYTKV